MNDDDGDDDDFGAGGGAAVGRWMMIGWTVVTGRYTRGRIPGRERDGKTIRIEPLQSVLDRVYGVDS